MMSVWRHSFYYLFAFLVLTFIILLIASAEISIVLCYLQLCNGNHRWWWRSFLSSGSCAIYMFLYGVIYFLGELGMTRLSSIMLYFGYMFLISLIFFLLCGTVGFCAAFVFVRKMYSVIKID
eukprot:TRINITY_DN5283_c0_g1_i1.p1 TRINITY_DN5283_c0_g1~~TRINITY_DN5283_c0_g1_i1.p1  ORF type:complete len:122 (+),score=21.01 TRINITY_DN5283_c0_g1_i1:332-697(+)